MRPAVLGPGSPLLPGASTNLLYTPYPNLLIGSELLWGNLENVAGEDGDDYRLQFTFKHKFGKSL